MALDNREKRASVVSTNPGAPPSPTPLAAMDQEWRQAGGWAYSGILVGVSYVIPPEEPEKPIVLIGAAALHGSHHLDEDDGRKEILKFWQEYYQNVLKLTQAQARMRAEEMVQASLQDELDLIDLTLL